ncbi:MAG: DoxX family membrane protein [Bacteroidota bacterium]
MSKTLIFISWGCRIIAALIMIQTLFFKFTGAKESIYIFSTLGIEPWGRYGSGMVELVAAILLLTPSLTWLGALLGLGTMSGALLSHLTVLGISVPNSDGTYDGGYLFGLALAVWVSCAVVLFIHRKEIPIIGQYLPGNE